MRALFYSHDVFGLGHIRRTLALAGELGRRLPGAAMLALTGSFETHAWELPDNFDYVKLPAWNRNALYGGLPPHASRHDPFRDVTYLREGLIQETADAFSPHLLIVDNAPAGLNRELVRALACLRAASPPVHLVFIMADIYDSASATRRSWQRDGADWLLEEVYDDILVFGMREVYDIVAEYGLPPATAEKVTYCGYYRRTERLTPPEEVRAALGVGDAPLLVLAPGGGADAQALVSAFLGALREPALAGIGAHAFAVTGPLINPHERTRVEAAAQGIPNLTVRSFEEDLLSYLNAADVVVGMCGYNTTVETLSLGKRLVAIPRQRPEEQMERATRFAERGLLTMLHPSDLTPSALAQAILQRLIDPPPPAVLDFDGLRNAGDVLVPTP
ncbi:MAG: glycosyltransferase [Chloroflexi bacterium]|nr:MAG: glycosyltransferase [Chloroflexota bacterium]